MTLLDAENDPARLLQQLMDLDRAAVEGYQIASEHVENREYREQLQAFKADHQRHIVELEPLLRRFGGDASAGEAKVRVLPGMVAIADKQGDQAILLAMENNEEGTRDAYRDALERAPEQAREVIARGCDDEVRHAQWLQVTLSELSASASYQGAKPPPRPGAAPPSG